MEKLDELIHAVKTVLSESRRFTDASQSNDFAVPEELMDRLFWAMEEYQTRKDYRYTWKKEEESPTNKEILDEIKELKALIEKTDI